MEKFVKTSVKDIVKSKHFRAEWKYKENDTDMDVVCYSSQHIMAYIRTWNAGDRKEILDALDDAYEEGRLNAQLEIQKALGLK